MMTSLEAALRGGSITVLLVFSILCWRFREEFPPLRYAALYSLSSAGYTYASAWPIPDRLVLLDAIFAVLLCLIPATFWLLTGALFDDGFVPSARKHAVLAVQAALGVAIGLTHWHAAWLVDLYFAAAAGFFAAGSVTAVSGFVDDLVQGRRQLRILVLFLAPIHAFALIAAELLSPGVSLAETGRIFNSWIIAISSGLIAIIFLKPHPILAATRTIPAPRHDPQIEKLDRLLTGERLYRNEKLSVTHLAKRMGMSESRLRELINTKLGHRNFPAFVNGYRLADARAALADPAQAEVPILTIALDAGFGSIGPFNRAFKANTGLTPREFRQTHLDRVSASPKRNSARSELPA